ncbi:3-oxoacyl-[acyl-carrier-protein] reductase [Okibacterium endophyticum]
MEPLAGKTAVVTGAARGIGLEYALRLARLGADVAVCDRNLESALEYEQERARLVNGNVADTIAQFGRRVITSELNVTDQAATEEFVRRVEDDWGHIDVVVCNAGGGVGDTATATPTRLSDSQAHDLFERNLFGTINTVRAVAPGMKSHRSGKIITVASVSGTRPEPSAAGADYAAAKAAVVSYTQNLAQELGPYGVTANAIAPGFIGSGQWLARFAEQDPKQLEEMLKRVPLGRLGTPEDCARIIEFLATELSDYVTGQVIVVDGGRLI